MTGLVDRRVVTSTDAAQCHDIASLVADRELHRE